MDNDSIRLLEVSRRYSDGSEAIVGKLAQNRQGVFFQYDTGYLSKGSSHSLSPFKLPFDGDLHGAPKDPHQGLHGVFSDSLPDGWGTLLMDRVFRQNGRLPHHITVMDRLAYTGNRGMGALSYSPVIEYSREQGDLMDIAVLGQEAQLIFDGETDHVLSALAQAGGSGGARPKAIVYLDPVTPNFATTVPGKAGLEPWVVKFTSKNLPLGHEEGLCEAAWLAMAQSAGIDVPKWQLIPADAPTGASAWLALRRFDCSENGRGRYHMQTLSGLLDADYRLPSLDYEDVIKATQVLCNSPAAGQQQFDRALYNLFAVNQDDHGKNWSFLMDDHGQWVPAPFYDVTFSPGANGEHTTAYGGFGKQPDKRAIQKLAALANYSWPKARQVMERAVDALAEWPKLAANLSVSKATRNQLSQQLNNTYDGNKHLLS